MRNWLEMLALFTASDVFVNEGVHERPPIVLFDEFQGKIVT